MNGLRLWVCRPLEDMVGSVGIVFAKDEDDAWGKLGRAVSAETMIRHNLGHYSQRENWDIVEADYPSEVWPAVWINLGGKPVM